MRFSTKLLSLCAVLAFSACSESSNVGPDFEPGMAVVPVTVSAAPGLSTLVVEVTATDITTPLAYNLTMVDGTASDTITIPAGSDRTITVRGYDSNNIETHRGSTVTNLVEGSNTAVTVTLDPLAGDQPVVVVMGGVTVEISPAVDTVAVGSTIQLTGVVLNDQGDTLEVTPVWSTLNPAVATVDSTGLVTGASAGSATIVGTYGGVGASAAVTVSDYVAFAACGDPMMDQDGNIYGTVEINGLCWFSENLTTALYTDGAPIEEIQDSVAWSSATGGAWSKLFNDPLNEVLYGKLYNHAAITDERGICPGNWRIPERDEQIAMVGALGAEPIPALKAESGWTDVGGVNGTNTSGYSALPGGSRNGSDTNQGALGFFAWYPEYAAWWSGTAYSGTSNYVFRFPNFVGGISYDQAGLNAGYPIRCVL